MATSSIRKNEALGMNYSTASNRLVKDLLFNFIEVTGKNLCYRCNKPMERSNFSIEHKEAWLGAEDPVKAFFDLNNISYSHLSCNIIASNQPIHGCGTIASYTRGCRCELCKAANAAHARKKYSTEKRRNKFARTGY